MEPSVRAHYFLGNQLLATSTRPPMWADAVIQETNVGMMCGTCGEVWARVINTRATHWTFQMRECAKHGGGSFIAAWANQFEELPPEVLCYELNLLLARYEKTNQSPATTAGTRLALIHNNGSPC